ncbi:hypothetical protein E2C01_043766 [Portunus trituberculatus]|uniref:Uncharacterized protein n=1 Tax=Portunus trituberculatus TaxID=210409 RepID=A0A5B7FR48_PORTR|nr:hypothetical protein [Portunus trituberculatus]
MDQTLPKHTLPTRQQNLHFNHYTPQTRAHDNTYRIHQSDLEPQDNAIIPRTPPHNTSELHKSQKSFHHHNTLPLQL